MLDEGQNRLFPCDAVVASNWPEARAKLHKSSESGRSMDSLELAKQILITNLQLANVNLKAETEIMGNFPQFNSLSIAGIIAAIEDELGCAVDDDEITGEHFLTVASLAEFIESKSG
jgi:acyl carrier protein